MRKIKIEDMDIFVTCNRKIDHMKFNKICYLLLQVGHDVTFVEKSAVILIQGDEENYVIERMNTDTYTLHVHFVISRQNAYKITENQTIS
ncbi:hypothetical protein CJ195_04835 [Bacillus sp. UMB0899]|nr:hypothetical protein CJ195_04835 [Bacillus sp. UMB0899]